MRTKTGICCRFFFLIRKEIIGLTHTKVCQIILGRCLPNLIMIRLVFNSLLNIEKRHFFLFFYETNESLLTSEMNHTVHVKIDKNLRI